jgi:hypothetical protein
MTRQRSPVSDPACCLLDTHLLGMSCLVHDDGGAWVRPFVVSPVKPDMLYEGGSSSQILVDRPRNSPTLSMRAALIPIQVNAPLDSGSPHFIYRSVSKSLTTLKL